MFLVNLSGAEGSKISEIRGGATRGSFSPTWMSKVIYCCNILHYINSKAEHMRASRTLAIAALFIKCSPVKTFATFRGRSRGPKCSPALSPFLLAIHHLFISIITSAPPAKAYPLPHCHLYFLLAPLPFPSYLNTTYIILLSTRTTNT